MEYIPLEAPGVLVPLFLGASSARALWSIHVVEAMAVFLLTFCSGFMANSLADVDVDSRYKTFVSDSVRFLGKRTVVGLIVAHIALALLITLHLSVAFDNYWLLFWVPLGIFFALAYSLKPFHFKVRGPLQILQNVFSLIMVSLLYYVVGGIPTAPVFLVFLGLLVAHYGIELVNQARDFLDDRESGLNTPAVRYGIRATLVASLVVTLAGLVSATAGFYVLFSELPDLAVAGVTLTFRALFAASVVILASAYYRPLHGIRGFIRISLQDSSDEHKILLIKEQLNYPMWQLSGILGVVLVATLLFAWKTA